MYERIRERPPLYKIYVVQLSAENQVTDDEVEDIAAQINERLETAFQAVRQQVCVLPSASIYEDWDGIHGEYSHEPVKTGVDKRELLSLAQRLNTIPKGFSIHPKLAGLFKKRLEAIERGTGIDWANAEALAFGSLLVYFVWR